MIRAYYTQAPAEIMTTDQWKESHQRLLPLLPGGRQEKFQRIRHRQTLLNSMLSMLLLRHAMQQADFTAFKLRNLQYVERRKPFHPKLPSFNISHSSEVTLCAICDAEPDPHVEIGIDVEHIRPIEPERFDEYITAEELDMAHSSPAPFFHCWTQKEAVIKAEGNGGVWDMSKVRLHWQTARYLDEDWKLVELNMPSGYIAHTAYFGDTHAIDCQAIEVNHLLNNFLTTNEAA